MDFQLLLVSSGNEKIMEKFFCEKKMKIQNCPIFCDFY